MKRAIGIVVVLAVVLGILALASPAVRDELHWCRIARNAERGPFIKYLRKWPEGRHVVEAQHRIEELRWEQVKQENAFLTYQRYMEDYPSGRYVAEARARQEELLSDDSYFLAAQATGTRQAYERFLAQFPGHRRDADAREALAQIEEDARWEEAQRANTVKSYGAYLAAYPEGRFAAEAEAKRTALRQDNTPYLAAQAAGTREAYIAFLEDYAGHRSEAAARSVLTDMEGRDIADLIAEGKVQVKATGSGMESVDMQVRRRVKHEVRAQVPVGTFFVSHSGYAQNMVATRQDTLVLADDDWHSLTVSAACANRERDVPGGDDGFSIRRSPQQANLKKLMPALETSRAGYTVQQAAVWIVTDNADYDDLGTLVEGIGGFGPRAIDETEAAEAMKIVDEAGVDITRRAIWRDRNEILRGLEDESLKEWIRARARR